MGISSILGDVSLPGVNERVCMHGVVFDAPDQKRAEAGNGAKTS
jgi:hypothetical protein